MPARASELQSLAYSGRRTLPLERAIKAHSEAYENARGYQAADVPCANLAYPGLCLVTRCTAGERERNVWAQSRSQTHLMLLELHHARGGVNSTTKCTHADATTVPPCRINTFVDNMCIRAPPRIAAFPQT